MWEFGNDGHTISIQSGPRTCQLTIWKGRNITYHAYTLKLLIHPPLAVHPGEPLDLCLSFMHHPGRMLDMSFHPLRRGLHSLSSIKIGVSCCCSPTLNGRFHAQKKKMLLVGILVTCQVMLLACGRKEVFSNPFFLVPKLDFLIGSWDRYQNLFLSKIINTQ